MHRYAKVVDLIQIFYRDTGFLLFSAQHWKFVSVNGDIAHFDDSGPPLRETADILARVRLTLTLTPMPGPGNGGPREWGAGTILTGSC